MSLIKFICQVILIAYYSSYYAVKFVVRYTIFKNRDSIFVVTKQWSNKLLNVGGIQTKVHGTIPKNGESFVYVANHSSLWDIPVAINALDDKIRIMYKKELEKIPIFGFALKVSPFIAVTRQEAKNAMNSIKETVETMKNGSSVLVYPEGTRSKDGNIQAFKRGAFLLAEKAGKPIIPLSIIGTFDIMRKGEKKIHGGIVNVHINRPIEVKENMSKVDEKVLMENVHSVIKADIDSYTLNK